MSEHRDDGACWCDDSGAGRVAALDRLYPDRCRCSTRVEGEAEQHATRTNGRIVLARRTA